MKTPPYVIAKMIQKEMDIVNVFKSLYIKNGSHYVLLEEPKLGSLIWDAHEEILPGEDLNSYIVEEIIYFLERTKVIDEQFINPPDGLPVKNGILKLDYRTKKIDLYENTDDAYTFWGRIEYDKARQNECVNSALAHLKSVIPSDDEINCLIDILAMGAWPILRDDVNFDHIVLQIGPGADGKSALNSMISNIFGDAVSAISIEQLSERFAASGLLGKRINIATENAQRTFRDNPLLKALTSGDKINVEEKYKGIQSAELKPVLIFALNKEPIFGDASPAIKRRMVIVRFPNVFKTEPKDGELLADPELRNPKSLISQTIQQGLLHLMIQAAERLCKTKKITATDPAIIDEIQKENAHLYRFFYEYLEKCAGNTIPTGEVFDVYKNFCRKEGHLILDNSLRDVWVDPHEYDKVCRSAGQLSRKLKDLFPAIISRSRNDQERLLKGIRYIDPNNQDIFRLPDWMNNKPKKLVSV
ncbi:MAG: phage/plasmid primase, P4 family [Candidatus Saganbacteria bacterium]|nr:phage/plasmid primase, P4 family [Candidatus Saganbacteria bacterium]